MVSPSIVLDRMVASCLAASPQLGGGVKLYALEGTLLPAAPNLPAARTCCGSCVGAAVAGAGVSAGVGSDVGVGSGASAAMLSIACPSNARYRFAGGSIGAEALPCTVCSGNKICGVALGGPVGSAALGTSRVGLGSMS